MSKTTQPAATGSFPKLSLQDLARINPLIEVVHDTTQVQAVLGFLAFSFQNSGGAISDSDSIGVGAILETCRAALAVMGEVHHGE